MDTKPSNRAFIYRNVMETLVKDELDVVMAMIPPRQAKYINKAEVIAFTLNRLPALYATSEKGWQQQRIRGKRDFGVQITKAVRQAINAVQQDPFRLSQPLQQSSEWDDANAALQKFKELLNRNDLTWKNVAGAVEQALVQASQQSSYHASSMPTSSSADWNGGFYER